MDRKYSLPSNSELLMSMFVLASLDLLRHSTALLAPRDDSTSAHAHTFVYKRHEKLRMRTAKRKTAECEPRSANHGVRTAERSANRGVRTAEYEPRSANRGLRTAECELRTTNYELGTAEHEPRTGNSIDKRVGTAEHEPRTAKCQP